MRIVGWQFGRRWVMFPYFTRARSNVEAGGKYWPEWYAFIGPLQLRIWGKPRR